MGLPAAQLARELLPLLDVASGAAGGGVRAHTTQLRPTLIPAPVRGAPSPERRDYNCDHTKSIVPETHRLRTGPEVTRIDKDRHWENKKNARTTALHLFNWQAGAQTNTQPTATGTSGGDSVCNALLQETTHP
eukprot:1874355-Lingulodinium_polyedra.AAC.1